MVESYEIRDKFVKKLNLLINRIASGKDAGSLLNEVILAASEYDKAIIERMEEIEANNIELSIKVHDVISVWNTLITKLSLMGINYEYVLLIDYKKLMADKYSGKTRKNYAELKEAISKKDFKTIAKCITQ